MCIANDGNHPGGDISATKIFSTPTNTNNAANPHPHDILSPPFTSPHRRSAPLVATFNLLATIVGAAVLSLPLAFAQCGVPLATALIVFAAYITDRSVWMLCVSARRTGASTYGEVVRFAFGERMERGVSAMLFVFLMFVNTGYMVLLRDIWTPLVDTWAGVHAGGDDDGGYDAAVGNAVLLGIMAVLSPFLVQRTLHALRWNCYIGFCSVNILCTALCRGGWLNVAAKYIVGTNAPGVEIDGGYDSYNHEDMNGNDGHEQQQSLTYAALTKVPTSQEILFAFPIIMLTFLCHFNAVAVQCALVRPSRQRTETVVDSAVLMSFAVCYLFGLGGYFYAGDEVKGNILLDVSENYRGDDGSDGGSYWLFFVGRTGYGITLMLAMPLVALPCRDSILELLDVCFRTDSAGASAIDTEMGNIVDGERTPLVQKSAVVSAPNDDEAAPILPQKLAQNPSVHYLSTFFIIGTCYTCAVAASGIEIVWSLCGSSMAFFIAFVVPSACFIKTERDFHERRRGSSKKGIDNDDNNGGDDDDDGQERLVFVAWGMLVFSIVGAIVCTYSNAASIFR